MQLNLRNSEIDELLVPYRRYLVGFGRYPERLKKIPIEQRFDAIEIYGSGFFFRFHGVTFIITAKHVVEDAVKTDTCIISELGSFLLVPYMVIPFPSDDLALVNLSELSNYQEITRFEFLNLE